MATESGARMTAKQQAVTTLVSVVLSVVICIGLFVLVRAVA